MKKHLVICVLLFFTSFAFAKDDDCPSAADAAEAQNPNAYKDCDYSQTGLNGVLHRALSKKKESSEELDDVPDETAVSSNNVSKEAKQKAVDKTLLLDRSEFKTAQQLQALKFNLLNAAATKCPKGFVVEGERYLPSSDKAMKLELIYHCL